MKKRIAYIVFMVVFIAFLLMSNRVVANTFGNRFDRIDQSIGSLKDRNVSCAIDSVKSEDQSLYERVLFVGWAFFTDYIQDEKYNAGIALENEKGEVYLFDAAPNYMRGDFKVMAGDTAVHGFEYSISTILVPSGLYKVYVYCKDENGNQGATATDYVLEKKGKNVSLYLNIWHSEVCSDFGSNSVDEEMVTYIDSKVINADGSATIAGWAYVRDQDAEQEDIYVMLLFQDGSNAFYDTKKIPRQDVADHYSNNLYYMSGFMAQIPAQELRSEEFRVYVMARDDQGLHTSSKMYEAVQAGLSSLSN